MLAVLMRKRRQQQSNHLLWRRSAFVELVEIQHLAGTGPYVPGPWRQRANLERHGYPERTPLVAAGDQERQTGVPGDPYLPEVYSALAWVSLQNLMPFGRPATNGKCG